LFYMVDTNMIHHLYETWMA